MQKKTRRKSTRKNKPRISRKAKEATKNLVGRPRNYQTPEELQQAILSYFHNCPDTRAVPVGFTIKHVPCPTITGLALYLGFCDRHALYNMESNPEFSDTIKQARSLITRVYEQITQGGNCTGAIFMLKNFGYSDDTNVKHSGIVATADVDVSKMSNEEIIRMLNARPG